MLVVELLRIAASYIGSALWVLYFYWSVCGGGLGSLCECCRTLLTCGVWFACFYWSQFI